VVAAESVTDIMCSKDLYVSATQQVIRFGIFELNLATHELRKADVLVRLAPQPFRLIALLATHAGRIVTRREIQQHLWGDDVCVDFEQAINHCIRQIRTVLNDNADNALYVETVHRSGYIFVAPVQSRTMPAPALGASEYKRGMQNGLTSPTITPTEERPLPASSEPVCNSNPTLVLDMPAPPARLESGATAVVVEPRIIPSLELINFQVPRVRVVWVGIALLLVLVAIGTSYIFLRSRNDAGQSRAGVFGMTGTSPRRSVAILGFKNLSSRSDEAWRSTALSEMLNMELAAGKRLRTIPGDEVNQMKINLALKEADSYGAEALARIRKNLDVDAVVVGSFIPVGNGQLRLDLRLQDTTTGETLAAITEKGREMDQLVSRAATALRQELRIAPISEAEAAKVGAAMPSSPAAVRLYSEGLAKLSVFDAHGAIEFLQRSVAEEPGYAPSHSALADAWKSLGYDKRAEEETQKAFDLSGNLVPEQQLLIEARYDEMSHRWDKAIDIYKKLWQGFPDDTEYGLDLASAQTHANKGNDALVTIHMLRKLAPPNRDDARIDLAEAYAAESLGNLDLQETAATKAAEKAQAIGSQLLLAKARTAQGKGLFYKKDYGGAIKMFKEARVIYERDGDRSEETASLGNIASVLFVQGDLADAQRMYQRELEVYREIGDRSSAAATLSNMGAVCQTEEDLTCAFRMYQKSLGIYQELADNRSQGIILNNLAEVLYLQARLPESRKMHERALQVDIESNDLYTQAEALLGLGQVLAAQGDLAAARERLEAVSRIGEAALMTEARLALAELSLEGGRPIEADASLRVAAEEFRRQELEDEEGEAENVLARSLLAQSKVSEAANVILEARAVTARSKSRRLQLSVAITAALIQAASGSRTDQDEAMTSLRHSIEKATRKNFVALQYEATLALGQIELKSEPTIARGRVRLAALEKQAGTRGFGAIARRTLAARTNLNYEHKSK